MRKSEIKRKTSETDILLYLNIDGEGISEINTGCGFLDHMLTLFAKHSGFDLSVKCKGDTFVDDHHTVEDVGICLGLALNNALQSKKGIIRFGSAIIPMDEALILAAVDISGRSHLSFNLEIPTSKVGVFDTQLIKEFMLAFVRNANLTLHLKQLDGENSHHIIEGCFKAFAVVLKTACKIGEKPNELPSTKGVI